MKPVMESFADVGKPYAQCLYGDKINESVLISDN